MRPCAMGRGPLPRSHPGLVQSVIVPVRCPAGLFVLGLVLVGSDGDEHPANTAMAKIAANPSTRITKGRKRDSRNGRPNYVHVHARSAGLSVLGCRAASTVGNRVLRGRTLTPCTCSVTGAGRGRMTPHTSRLTPPPRTSPNTADTAARRRLARRPSFRFPISALNGSMPAQSLTPRRRALSWTVGVDRAMFSDAGSTNANDDW
jgi:hypothetical protein